MQGDIIYLTYQRQNWCFWSPNTLWHKLIFFQMGISIHLSFLYYVLKNNYRNQRLFWVWCDHSFGFTGGLAKQRTKIVFPSKNYYFLSFLISIRFLKRRVRCNFYYSLDQIGSPRYLQIFPYLSPLLLN